MRLYLDNCCFNRPFDDQSSLTVRLETEAKLHIQNAIRAGQYSLCWPYILDYENAANPLQERRHEIQRWEALSDCFISETAEVLAIMNKVMTAGCKPLDALHVACAHAAGCGCFLTVDKGVLKKADKIKGVLIMNPIDFALKQGW